MHYEIRGGVRGGKDQFKWEDLKTMNYKDREQYLGFSTKIGFLDKGGKWRRKDWYVNKNDGNGEDEVQQEIRRVQEADQKRMRVALGLEAPSDDMPKLSGAELEEFQKKMHQITQEEKQNAEMESDEPEAKFQGIGTQTNENELQKKIFAKLKEKGIIQHNIHRLEGVGVHERQQIDNMVRNEMKRFQDPPSEAAARPSVEKKIKKVKKSKKEKKSKKDKKKKKDKKHKQEKKQRHDTSSDSD